MHFLCTILFNVGALCTLCTTFIIISALILSTILVSMYNKSSYPTTRQTIFIAYYCDLIMFLFTATTQTQIPDTQIPLSRLNAVYTEERLLCYFIASVVLVAGSTFVKTIQESLANANVKRATAVHV